MNDTLPTQAFAPAENLFKDALASGNVQAFAEKRVAAAQDMITKSTVAAQDHRKAITEIADTAWNSTKLLHETAAKNFAANVEAAMAAAQTMATAKSLPELGKAQVEFMQSFATQAAGQMKDYFDLSTRVSQHVLETSKAAAAKSFKRTV